MQTKTAARVSRPRRQAASSHSAIMDAVYDLLQTTSVRDLTMDQIAKRAGVGKPTLYKWWPTKASLVEAAFHERLAGKIEEVPHPTAEAALRWRFRKLIQEFNGLFGKVMADLIAEVQSEPAILRDLNEHLTSRAAAVAIVERGIASGEFAPDTDPEFLIDVMVGPIYYQLLLQRGQLTESYADKLITKPLIGITL
jgi:AcrR family transcriptional regulator